MQQTEKFGEKRTYTTTGKITFLEITIQDFYKSVLMYNAIRFHIVALV